MTGDEDVVGTVEVKGAGGKFDLPERYAEADAIVVRDPSKTVNMPSGSPAGFWYYDPTPGKNPDLAPDRVTLKVHGEDAEVYRVEGVDKIETATRSSDGDK